MNPKALLLAVFLITQLVGAGLFAQTTFRKVFNEDGWTVPGVADRDRMPRVNKHERNIEGKRVQVTNYGGGLSGYVTKFPIINESNSTVKYKEIEIEVLGIQQYDIEGRPFCYMVHVGLMVHGNSMPAAYHYAYYDEIGNGQFQTREDPDIWLNGDHGGYQIRLPEWAKNIAQGR